MSMEKKTRPKNSAYCTECLFTIRKGELVNTSVAPIGYKHINCAAAIQDGTGRIIHPDFKHLLNGFDTSVIDNA